MATVEHVGVTTFSTSIITTIREEKMLLSQIIKRAASLAIKTGMTEEEFKLMAASIFSQTMQENR